jgi:hypothetical protein
MHLEKLLGKLLGAYKIRLGKLWWACKMHLGKLLGKLLGACRKPVGKLSEACREPLGPIGAHNYKRGF